jgi:hypothetical protein
MVHGSRLTDENWESWGRIGIVDFRLNIDYCFSPQRHRVRREKNKTRGFKKKTLGGQVFD